MFLKFTEDAQKLLLLSHKEKNNLNDSYIGSEHIFLAVLKMNNTSIYNILINSGLSYDKLYQLLKKKEKNNKSSYFIFTNSMNKIFDKLLNSHIKNNNEITETDIIIEILNSNSKIVLLLRKINIDIKKLYKELNINNNKRKVSKKSILNEVGVNLNEKVNNQEIVLEREDEINRIIEILCCRNKNNPILIGEAGVGKTAIVEELARRIKNNKVPYKLHNKVIYSVQMSSLVAGTKYRGEFEEKINKLVKEVENNDEIILFIDEIHTLVGAGGADGAIDASNILKPALARGNIKIIGATTTDEYKKSFSNDKALCRRFQKILIEEPNEEKTKTILLGIKPIYEEYHNVSISDELIDKIIYYSSKYIKMRQFPDKAIDILDEVCVLTSTSFNKNYNFINDLDEKINNLIELKNKALLNEDYLTAMKYSKDERKIELQLSKTRKDLLKNNTNTLVTEDVLLKVIERKTNIPFYTYKYNYKDILNKNNKLKKELLFEKNIIDKTIKLTDYIYNNLINSGEAKKIYIYSNNQSINNYFINNYLNIYFDKCHKIYLDINNFRNIDDLIKGNLLEKLKENPFSIIVIDNYIDCDYTINNFFNMISKYSYFINQDNEKIDFSNSLIIYNTISNEVIGFNTNNELVDEQYLINLSNINNNKLRRLIKSKNKTFNKEEIDNIMKIIINNYDYINNLDYLIKSKMSNFEKMKKKTRAIKE